MTDLRLDEQHPSGRPARRHARPLLLAGLALVALAGLACGGDGTGANPDGGAGGGDASEVFDGAPYPDGPENPPPYMDPNTGDWICPDAFGQTFPCQCDDGQDNDGDGQIDTADADCTAPSDNFEGGVGTCGPTQCTNCVDDDGDGQIDSGDVECTGPLDNEEGSFATGIPGDNKDACKQDCWFDGNSGAGDDGCNWDLGCDPIAGPYYECTGGGNCDGQQTQGCIDYCQALTPNGCDCFGCCTVYINGTPVDLLLNPLCDVDDYQNTCTMCTKVDACSNDCGACEYCLGKEPDPSCTEPGTPDGGTPPGQCPTGVTACDPDQPASCPAGQYCLTGCCIDAVE